VAMRYLVLGATGGLGSAVLRRLRPGEARVLVRDADEFWAVHPGEGGDFDVLEGDLSSDIDVDHAIDGVGTVLHCASTSYFHWGDLIGFTRRVIKAAEEEEQRVDIVYPGGVLVYGAPLGEPVKESEDHAPCSRKGTIQANIERCLREANTTEGCRTTVLRTPDLYGPGFECLMAERLFKRAAAGKAVKWPGPLDVPREFVYVDDAAEAMLMLAGSDRAWGEAWHLPGPAAITPKDLATMAFEEAGHAPHVERMGALAHRMQGTLHADWKEEQELLYLFERPVLLDGTRFARMFGRVPSTPYREGVKRTMEWWKRRLEGE
jgi:nucleoside-diphosphate-sugar epimerase